MNSEATAKRSALTFARYGAAAEVSGVLVVKDKHIC